jgi:hypothetical protein
VKICGVVVVVRWGDVDVMLRNGGSEDVGDRVRDGWLIEDDPEAEDVVEAGTLEYFIEDKLLEGAILIPCGAEVPEPVLVADELK